MFINCHINQNYFEKVKISKKKVDELIERISKNIARKVSKSSIVFTAYKNYNKSTIYKKIDKKVSEKLMLEIEETLHKLEKDNRAIESFNTLEEEDQLKLFWKKRLIGRVFTKYAKIADGKDYREFIIRDVLFEKKDFMSRLNIDINSIHNSKILIKLDRVDSKIPEVKEMKLDYREFLDIDWNYITKDSFIENNELSWKREFDIFKENQLQKKIQVIKIVNSKKSSKSVILQNTKIKTEELAQILDSLIESKYIELENKIYKLNRSIPNPEYIKIFLYIYKKERTHTQILKSCKIGAKITNRVLDELFEAGLIKFSRESKLYQVISKDK